MPAFASSVTVSQMPSSLVSTQTRSRSARIGGEVGEVVVAGAEAPRAAAEVRRVAGTDADVGQVTVGRHRDAEAHDVEVVADGRTGLRRSPRSCRSSRCRSEPPFEMNGVSSRSPRPVSEKSPGTSPTHCSSAALVSPHRQGAEAARHEDRAGGLAEGAALAARGVVGADGGAEGDAAVGLAGHVDAEADAGDGAEIVRRGDVAVVVESPCGSSRRCRCCTQDPDGRRRTAPRPGPRRSRRSAACWRRWWRREPSSSLSSCFFFETHLKSECIPGPVRPVFPHRGPHGQANGEGRDVCLGR